MAVECSEHIQKKPFSPPCGVTVVVDLDLENEEQKLTIHSKNKPEDLTDGSVSHTTMTLPKEDSSTNYAKQKPKRLECVGNHFPELMPDKMAKSCSVCSNVTAYSLRKPNGKLATRHQTRYWCPDCKTPLCISPRPCFKRYHTEVEYFRQVDDITPLSTNYTSVRCFGRSLNATNDFALPPLDFPKQEQQPVAETPTVEKSDVSEPSTTTPNNTSANEESATTASPTTSTTTATASTTSTTKPPPVEVEESLNPYPSLPIVPPPRTTPIDYGFSSMPHDYSSSKHDPSSVAMNLERRMDPSSARHLMDTLNTYHPPIPSVSHPMLRGPPGDYGFSTSHDYSMSSMAKQQQAPSVPMSLDRKEDPMSASQVVFPGINQ